MERLVLEGIGNVFDKVTAKWQLTNKGFAASGMVDSKDYIPCIALSSLSNARTQCKVNLYPW
jgi:hypothetical protein